MGSTIMYKIQQAQVRFATVDTLAENYLSDLWQDTVNRQKTKAKQMDRSRDDTMEILHFLFFFPAEKEIIKVQRAKLTTDKISLHYYMPVRKIKIKKGQLDFSRLKKKVLKWIPPLKWQHLHGI